MIKGSEEEKAQRNYVGFSNTHGTILCSEIVEKYQKDGGIGSNLLSSAIFCLFRECSAYTTRTLGKQNEYELFYIRMKNRK